MDGVNPGEIGFIHRMLAAGAGMGMLAQRLFQRINRPVQHWHDRQAQRTAPLFQPDPDIGIGQGEEHQAGIGGDFPHDPVQMLERPDHRPEMPANLCPFELGQGRLGDHLQRFTGGIRQEVKVQARHGVVRQGPCGQLPA